MTRPASQPRVRANLAVGTALMALLAIAVILSLFWMPYDPLKIDIHARLHAPSVAHWLGTDEFGRDVLSRAMVGARISTLAAVVTVLTAVLFGTTIGLIAGYWRGTVDRIVMLLNDALLAFPGILLALAAMVIVGPGLKGVIVALSVAYVPTVVRLVRGTVLSVREREFVEASRVIGNSEFFTMWRHVLPNTAAHIIVLATSLFGWVILAESALSFLGMGIAAPAPSWGNMLAASRPYMDSALWLSLAPGLCISLTLLGVNLLGDALRDLLDPRMQ